LKKFFKSVLSEYDFGERLNEEQIQQLRNKDFHSKMPKGGVTNLRDLIKLDTGEHYSDKEIKSLSDEEKLELLKECRRIDVNFLAKKKVEIQEMQPKPLELNEMRILEKTFSNWGNYNSVALIADNSPSTFDSFKKFIEIIEGQDELKDTEIIFGHFSNKLEKFEKVQDLNELAGAMEKTNRKVTSHQERAIESALSAIQEMEVEQGERAKLLVMTDEPLQNLNYQNLQQLKAEADAKNCEVDFIYAHQRQGGAAHILSLEELINSYQQIAWEEFSLAAKNMISKEEQKLSNLQLTESRLNNLVDRTLSRDNLSRSDKKSFEQRAENYQNRLASVSEQISQSRLLLGNLEQGLTNGDLEELELAIRANNSRYSSFKVNIDPAERNLGVNISLADNK